ncbi:hypothetical protein GSI_14333 [Ganoderma sinense ZZ0214-1]|uniref:Uncharacterized protein n=1 Tax=Ganoderma sinense ZZ0214-1 TaxID=1077348 RepID=A0A2G8RND9_9APHY|nr:hypothetical protein GSI_14333 [Ganoderma sinense ZZ0214-1]
MATHVNRRRPSVAWDTNATYYPIESLDDSPATPATPQQDLTHNHPQQLPRSLSGQRPAADPRAYQQQSSQVPGVLPVPGQYAHPAGPVYPAFYHAQYLAGTAVPGAPHLVAAGTGAQGPRSGAAAYGYPAQTATVAAPAPAPTPSAPLMTNASLPPTPSETTPTHSPGPSTSSLDGSPHAPSASSWGTPSPEPEPAPERNAPGQRGSQQPEGDLSPHLAQFKLEWDMRDQELETLPHPPWFQEPAFASRRTTCTVAVKVGGPEPEWVEVPRRKDGRALTVGDVVGALDAWLWEAVGDDAIYRAGAADNLFYRNRGPEDSGDAKKNTKRTFRNVDHFGDDESHFEGFKEVPGKNTASTLLLCVKKSKSQA